MVTGLLRMPQFQEGGTHALDWAEHTHYFIERHDPFGGTKTTDIAWHGGVKMPEAKRRLRSMRRRKMCFYARRRWWTGWHG